ncbi:MAG: hypothetical protein AB7V46_07235 [Thermomicrobiales bacterium]
MISISLDPARHFKPVYSRIRDSSRSAIPRWIGFIMIVGLLLSMPGSTVAQSSASIVSATEWLISQRLENGAYPGFDGSPDAVVTVDAVTALALAGFQDEAEESTLYLESEALVFAQIGPGSAAKLALMLVASGKDPHNFAFVDPLSIVEHAANAGMIGFGPYDHALGLLALSAGGSDIPEVAVEALFQSKADGAGWAFDGSTDPAASDTNTTALIIRAAHAIGRGDDQRIASAAEWLASLRTAEGFPYQPEGPSDANSTALSLQALVLYPGFKTEEALAVLSAFQNDNGSFSWMLDPRDENIFSTVQAIPSLVALSVIDGQTTADPGATPAGTPAAMLRAA